jgi:hypothetical protein
MVAKCCLTPLIGHQSLIPRFTAALLRSSKSVRKKTLIYLCTYYTICTSCVKLFSLAVRNLVGHLPCLSVRTFLLMPNKLFLKIIHYTQLKKSFTWLCVWP